MQDVTLWRALKIAYTSGHTKVFYEIKYELLKRGKLQRDIDIATHPE